MVEQENLISDYRQNIIDYYDRGEVSYRDVWDLDVSLSLHYGLWDRNTKNLRQALRNTNSFMAERAKILPSDMVFDAGCGVGGSLIFLGENYQCKGIGYTLSPGQVKFAETEAQKRGQESNLRFVNGDYENSGLPDESVSVFWSIEAACYALDKKTLIREIFRLLKPGGRLILADAYYSRESYNETESRMLDETWKSWAVEYLAHAGSFTEGFREQGFVNVDYRNVSPMIMPSARRLYVLGQAALTLGKIYRLVGKSYGNKQSVRNALAAVRQYQTIKKGLWEYGILYAEKPMVG